MSSIVHTIDFVFNISSFLFRFGDSNGVYGEFNVVISGSDVLLMVDCVDRCPLAGSDVLLIVGCVERGCLAGSDVLL